MPHKFDPHHAERLEHPDRKKILDPSVVLAPLELTSGIQVADVGCGTGFFTLPLAQAVGSQGKVYAIDISPELLNRTRENLKTVGLENIEFVQSTEIKIPLEDETVDAVLLANVLHEVSDNLVFLSEINRIMKIDGTLLVVEWKKEQTTAGPPVEDRLASNQVISSAEQVGFSKGIISEAGPYHYSVRFKKLIAFS